MTPEDKSKEITLKYYKLGEHLYIPMSFAKQCALIAVDEIIDSLQIKNYTQADQYEYWNEVKHEINKL
jgi:hypothetical protein